MMRSNLLRSTSILLLLYINIIPLHCFLPRISIVRRHPTLPTHLTPHPNSNLITNHRPHNPSPPPPLFSSSSSSSQSSSESPNWIERSTPTGLTPDDDETAEYSLGIDGQSFSLGPLSQKLYDALLSVAAKRFPSNEGIPLELLKVYKSYAMNLAAKQAIELALRQNGLQLDIPTSEAQDDQEDWGDVQQVTVQKNQYESFDEAVQTGDWMPGRDFSFVATNVPAKPKEMDIQELLAALDPDGAIREELAEREEMMDDPMERIKTLRSLAEDNERRCNTVPTRAEEGGFAGGGTDDDESYRPIPLRVLEDALREGGDSKLMNRIMSALESHSCLILSLPESDARLLQRMWNATSSFFDTTSKKTLPSMDIVPEAGSRHAVVGYASYENDSMQFLETRIRRTDSTVLPPSLIDHSDDIQNAFRRLASIGSQITKLATIAASLQSTTSSNMSFSQAQSMAQQLIDDILDDGTERSNVKDTPVCMSPHRLCKYTFTETNNNQSSKRTTAKEIFGAHTDTSFLTIVPVAQISGLEIFDEDNQSWIRPELIAQMDWEQQRFESNDDDSKLSSSSSDNDDIPWHCRYVVLMPGELLQIVTRGMIVSAVHRVIGVKDGGSRLSAPILLRGRSKVLMDVEKYFEGETKEEVGNLILDCDGMSMEEIHDTLQPSFKG